MSLTGKVALITGAGRGIGRGCALELARQGADVVLNDLCCFEGARALAEEVKGLGRQALPVHADVSNREQVERMLEMSLQEFGRLDIVVANAARNIKKPFLELTPEDVEAVWSVVLWGVFHTCQLCARQMVQQASGGSIILVSSVHADMPMRGSLPYTAGKAAVNHMGRVMANELAAHRIRVNVVEPGWTDTPGEREFASEQEIREHGGSLPLGRLAKVEDIAHGVAFLASEKADYITGATLRIDGGFILPNKL